MSLIYTRQKIAQLPHDQYWQIGEQTGELLRDTVVNLNAQKVLEIGTSSGYSSLWIIEGLQTTGGHLITIESHKERYELGQEHFKAAEVEKYVTHLKGHAPEIFSEIQGPFDLVFYDATKKQTTEVVQALIPLMATGSQIIVDNISSHPDEHRPFIKFLESQKIPYERRDVDAGILIIQPAENL